MAEPSNWASNAVPGTIDRANLDGTGVTRLVSGQDFPIALTVDGSHLYWCSSGRIDQANLDGTGVTTLVSAQYAFG
jgi:hypothetical protein